MSSTRSNIFLKQTGVRLRVTTMIKSLACRKTSLGNLTRVQSLAKKDLFILKNWLKRLRQRIELEKILIRCLPRNLDNYHAQLKSQFLIKNSQKNNKLTSKTNSFLRKVIKLSKRWEAEVRMKTQPKQAQWRLKSTQVQNAVWNQMSYNKESYRGVLQRLLLWELELLSMANTSLQQPNHKRA